MMINYAGKKVNKCQAAAATPRSSNPNLGFIGNPYSWSGPRSRHPAWPAWCKNTWAATRS
ncbi:hypothetical protein ME782_07980 [Lactobacillus delbrueckii]|nr:hypothetical protein ME782_07980 [Lactobacillus delbrueckii]